MAIISYSYRNYNKNINNFNEENKPANELLNKKYSVMLETSGSLSLKEIPKKGARVQLNAGPKRE